MNSMLAENIKRFRRERNMTQEDVAAELGVSYQAVSRWETAASYPDIELLPNIAALFGVSMDILFGMDKNSEEQLLMKFDKEYDAAKDDEERILVTKKYIDMLPSNAYLKSVLISQYRSMGIDYATERLEEMRKLCRYVIEHSTDSDYWRDTAIADMIVVETDDNVGEWLSALDHRTIISSREAQIDRFDERNEVDKYNEAIQEDIIRSLTNMFSNDFCKRDAITYGDPKSRADGQKLILKTIDIYRDPNIEVDAWIQVRAFAYMRLAARRVRMRQYR